MMKGSLIAQKRIDYIFNSNSLRNEVKLKPLSYTSLNEK